jgi:hypothetical protein
VIWWAMLTAVQEVWAPHINSPRTRPPTCDKRTTATTRQWLASWQDVALGFMVRIL